jgi:hypothetical protein
MSDCIGTPVSITPIHTPVHTNESAWEGMPLISYRPPAEIDRDLRPIGNVFPPLNWNYSATMQSVDHHTVHLMSPYGHHLPVMIDVSRENDIKITYPPECRAMNGELLMAIGGFLSTYAHKQAMWAWHGIEPK